MQSPPRRSGWQRTDSAAHQRSPAGSDSRIPPPAGPPRRTVRCLMPPPWPRRRGRSRRTPPPLPAPPPALDGCPPLPSAAPPGRSALSAPAGPSAPAASSAAFSDPLWPPSRLLLCSFRLVRNVVPHIIIHYLEKHGRNQETISSGGLFPSGCFLPGNMIL